STWSWMLNSDSGIVNAALHALGIGPVNWLTSPSWSLTSVIIANIWIGVPFNLVVLHSGLQSIPASLYEAAALDGANAWQRFWRITFPLLRPVSAITLLLGLIYTLKVFDIIWIMTKGGPADSSTTFATWSYQLGFGNLLPAFGPGAAVGNLLVVAALVFGLIYLKVQRKQALS
ncbi:carbohydrate ABC transporter permease, partial [Streptomyces sp. DSM 15324]|uniref:carbohydrate ABC transporter permease n=2 Tax=Streptomyces TaxID=1883 RepID=UPI00131DFA00